jgi:hypothetical protein
MNFTLGIAIPTYKRVEYFSRLMYQISQEILSLSVDVQAQIVIRIFENPSELSIKKKIIANELNFGKAFFEWRINEENIGGDANIEQAYIANQDCIFNWVLGDDEQLIYPCLAHIYDYLKNNHICGLLLLRDTTYVVSKKILDKNSWTNYEMFVKFVSNVQPHIILAHTLISGNIVRSGVYCNSEGLRERLIYAPRAGLPFSFAHMKAILTGLSSQEHLSVNLFPIPCLNTADRVEDLDDYSAQMNRWESMKILYRHHLYWISSEFGIDLEAIRQHPSLAGIFHISNNRNYLHRLYKYLSVKPRSVLKKYFELIKNYFS